MRCIVRLPALLGLQSSNACPCPRSRAAADERRLAAALQNRWAICLASVIMAGMNTVLLVAHKPLASALRDTARHILGDVVRDLQVVDVPATARLGDVEQAVEAAVPGAGGAQGLLVLTDIVGATPCNAASRLASRPQVRVLSGVNLPMLLRALTYQDEPLDVLAQRALVGGATGVMAVSEVTPAGG